MFQGVRLSFVCRSRKNKTQNNKVLRIRWNGIMCSALIHFWIFHIDYEITMFTERKTSGLSSEHSYVDYNGINSSISHFLVPLSEETWAHKAEARVRRRGMTTSATQRAKTAEKNAIFGGEHVGKAFVNEYCLFSIFFVHSISCVLASFNPIRTCVYTVHCSTENRMHVNVAQKYTYITLQRSSENVYVYYAYIMCMLPTQIEGNARVTDVVQKESGRLAVGLIWKSKQKILK